MRELKRGFITLIGCLAMAITMAMGQEARMDLRCPSSASAGQPFQITFVVNADAKGFKAPTFKGLRVLSGPNKSSSSSISIVNGSMSKSVTNSFTFIVQADAEGTAQIGVASCTSDGKTVQSTPASIRIEKADPNHQAANNNRNNNWGQPGYGQQSGQSQQAIQPASQINDRTLFARASINKSNLYQGEEAIIVYKIYTQVPITQFQIEKLPRNKGFWSEDLSENMTQVPQYEETYNGQRYHVAEIRRGALYPQESGELSIAPLKTDVLAIIQSQVQRQRTGTIFDFFIDDPFFNPVQQQSVVKTLSSNSLNVHVKPLPEAPESFFGGVGRLDVSHAVDMNEMRAGEAFTYRITVSGHGNLSLLEAPVVNFPTGFEVYEPKVSDKINKSDNGLSGNRTFEWVIIPQSAGSYTIPDLEYSYFNPQSGSYVTKNLKGFDIKVSKGQGMSTSKSDVTELNSDIHHIKRSTKLHRAGSDAHGGWLFWLLMVLPLVAATSVVIGVRRQQDIASDEGSLRLQRATKLAKKRLRNAERYLHQGDDARFYEEIYKALWGGIADKFNIQLSLLSSETVKSQLESKQVDAELQERIMKTLGDVDYARFAPGDSSAKKQSIYNEAMETIVQIGKLKNSRK